MKKLFSATFSVCSSDFPTNIKMQLILSDES